MEKVLYAVDELTGLIGAGRTHCKDHRCTSYISKVRKQNKDLVQEAHCI